MTIGLIETLARSGKHIVIRQAHNPRNLISVAAYSDETHQHCLIVGLGETLDEAAKDALRWIVGEIGETLDEAARLSLQHLKFNGENDEPV